jgi:glycine betaine/proline transport system permease protein
MTAVSVPLAGRLEFQLSKGGRLALLFAIAAVLFVLFHDQWTLPGDEHADLFLRINAGRDWVDENRTTFPLFIYVFEPIRAGIEWLIGVFLTILQGLSWIGLTATFGALALVFVSWRTALFVVASFIAFGLLGLWDSTVSTLDLMLTAVVLALAIGIPIGIVAGRSERFLRVVSPVLDLMQIMPTFAYLAPLTLIFLIGPPAATVATLIYAIPPAIRITALGIRGVGSETLEAAESMGSTGFQILRKVQLPMARRTIGLAVNQTIMFALSMIVITALIDAPGLGQDIIRALEKLNVGKAFEAGLAIVLLAMILDRITAAASRTPDHSKLPTQAGGIDRRRALIVGATVVTIGLIVAGNLLPIGKEFPDGWRFSFAKPVNDVVHWIEVNLYPVTDTAKNILTSYLVNPLQSVLESAPWWLVVGVAAGIAGIVSGRRAAVAAIISLILVVLLQLWDDSMQTLAMVLVAVVLTMLIGVTLGVASARDRRVAAVMRPINDFAQTLPAFVYLLPAVALFGPTRATAIVAAVIFAVPVVIRLVEDGIKGVSPTAIEAATAAGSTRLQMIRNVQLPMARRSLLVATNQGVVLVLSMVVVGGLVGGGSLGFDVVSGFSQLNNFGKGIAAAISIVLLGVLLDRITQGAGARTSGSRGSSLGIISMPLAILGFPARALIRRPKSDPVEPT